MSGRLQRAFEQAAAEGRAAFIAYLTAGFPSEERFLEAALEVLEHADVLEIGVPFSDPLGDGPTIQRAGEAALAAGTTTGRVLELAQRLRQATDKPLVLMTYYNPIYCFQGGEVGFVEAAARAGVDGVILPDLPPDEGGTLIEAARSRDLDTVFLVAPTSTQERLELVGRACRGFVYAVSVTGVTGTRESVPQAVGPLVQAARQASGLPVAVGFGVGSGDSAARVAALADGVVVGSALIERLARGEGLGELAAEIAAGVRRGRSNAAQQA